MTVAPLHVREAERLRILDELEILDTPAEDVFDRIAYIAAQVCGCPISLVNFIDRERQWFKAAYGTELRGSPREFAFCAHTILGDQLVVVDNALDDPRMQDNPLVLSDPRVRFYAGVPLRVGPLPLGTLCVIDVTPRTLSAPQRQALIALAREVEAQLELRRALHRTQRQGEDRRELATMIVHDMRSPLTVAMSGAQFLAIDDGLSARGHRVVREVLGATQRLERMVHDLLDVSRSDTGVLVPHADDMNLAAFAEQVASSLAVLAHDHRLVFETAFGGRADGRFDGDLVRRVIENLAENAFKYAPHESEVTVAISVADGDRLRIEVSDHGPGIPRDVRERIFDASYRLQRDALVHARDSYGLGLRLCRAAAVAMGGRIWVEDNTPAGARFIAELPIGADHGAGG
jgi:signal transduction histidine kinase